MQRATAFWTERRQQDLKIALQASLESPLGENDPKVINIRHMVDVIDHSVAAGALIRCGGDGIMANGEPIADLVAHNYLCHKWSAADGASMARSGQAPDKLPEELADELKNKGLPAAIPTDFESEVSTDPGPPGYPILVDNSDDS